MIKNYFGVCFFVLSTLISINIFAQISGPTVGCSSSATLGTYTAPPGGSFAWSVTSGPVGSVVNTPTTQTTSITFPGAGAYLVECLVNGASNYTYNVTINQSPSVSVSGPNAVCNGTTGNFIGNSNGASPTYSWTIDGGGTLTTPSNLNCDLIANAVGSYNITLVATDGVNGCIGGQTVAVIVDAAPSTAFISGPSTACNQTQPSYTANTAAGCSYSWSINSGGTLFGATTQFCDVLFNTAGTSTLTLYIQNIATSCSISTTKVVTVNPSPIANYPSVTMCNGDTITVTADTVAGATYSWNSVIAQTIGATNTQSITIAYTSGNNLGVSVTGSNGCLTSYSHVVTVNNLPDATITSDHTNLCAGGTAMLYPNGGTIFSWSPAIGLNSTNTQTVYATLDTAVTYTVVVYDANGCTSTASYTQNVISKDSLALYATDLTSCSGPNGQAWSSLYMPDNQPYTYSWDNSATTDTAFNLGLGSYTLTLTNAYGCTVSKFVAVNDARVYPSIDNTNVIQTNETCALANGSITGAGVIGGQGPFNYLWSNSATSVAITNLAAGNYDLTITDANGCASTAANYVISNSNLTAISGTISSQGTPLTSGTITILLLNGAGALTQSATIALVNGTYSFGGLSPVNYLLYAEADTAVYPNAVKTYFNGTNLWVDADTLSPTCGAPLTINYDVIETTPLVGSANISGIIYDNTVAKTAVQGDPIPGVDVSLEQNPGSIMLASTTTDNSGAFSFVNVPTGNFTIAVDVPGLPQVSTYDITVTGNNAIINKNFYVDSAGVVDTIPPIILKTPQVFNSVKVDFIAYPNPFSDNITLQYNVSEESKVNISVVNILGETVFNTARVTKQASNYYYNLNTKDTNIQAGIYFVRLEMNGKINTYKIVKRD